MSTSQPAKKQAILGEIAFVVRNAATPVTIDTPKWFIGFTNNFPQKLKRFCYESKENEE